MSRFTLPSLAVFLIITMGTIFFLTGGCQHPVAPPISAAPEMPIPDSPIPEFILGLNEAIAIPARLIPGKIAPDQIRGVLAHDAQEVTALGARMVRGHTGNFPNTSWDTLKTRPENLRQLDDWIATLQKNQITPVAMVSPWPGNRTGNSTEQYLPQDMNDYLRYVKDTVERYDGDGVGDMPGLRAPVIYWEIDNEPDLKNTNLPIDPVRTYDPATFCTPQEYATLLVATANAIREAFPDAQLLNGGFYRPAAPSTWAYMDAMLQNPAVIDSFDILSLHTYSDDPNADRVVLGIQSARQRFPDKPVWITEISVPSAGKNRDLTPDYQARMLIKTVGRVAAAGGSALLWHGFADPYDQPNPRYYGLQETLADGQHQWKPSGTAYHHLATVLATHNLTGAVEAPDHSGVQLKDGSFLLYEGTRPVTSQATLLLTGEVVTSGSVTAPAFLLP